MALYPLDTPACILPVTLLMLCPPPALAAMSLTMSAPNCTNVRTCMLVRWSVKVYALTIPCLDLSARSAPAAGNLTPARGLTSRALVMALESYR